MKNRAVGRGWMGALGLSGALLLAAISPVRAQGDDEKAPSGAPTTVQDDVMHVVATIEAIDRPNRRVTLAGPEGNLVVLDVPQNVKGFDKAKVGDRVNIAYQESVAVSIKKPAPGEKPSMGVTEQMAPVSGKQGRVMARQLEVTAEVISVDPATNRLTYRGPRGVKSVTVQDAKLRSMLKTLKPGDTVQLTITQAMAVALEPASGSSGK